MPEPDERDIAERLRAVAEDVRAPAGLRADLARRRLAGGRPARGSLRPRRALLPAGGLALAVGGLLTLAPYADAPRPRTTIAAAAEAGLRAPSRPAPEARAGEPFLRAEVDSVRFPNYAYDDDGGDWQAVGAREDRIGGRAARTVVYARGTARVGYTIVTGAPVPVPGSARPLAGGRDVGASALRRGATTIVTWRRGGHTCVLASRTTSTDSLLRLARWRA
jgi:hypothetical protein